MWQFLESLVENDPSIFLSEMRERLREHFGQTFAVSTICTTLRRHGYTWKKLHLLAMRRDKAEEEAWTAAMQMYPAHYFLFADESRKEPKSLHRRRGRGRRGFRVPVYQDLVRGTSFSALGVLSLYGMVDYAITSAKGVKTDMFVSMVADHIVPHCQEFPGPNSVVVMDNAEVHRDLRVRALIEATGARLLFLPAYANNLNPIEESFAKAKRFLERERELCQEDAKVAIAAAFESITAKDCAGYFQHAGYLVEHHAVIPGLVEFYS
mmetsp:Transcript_9951/g.17756  ORF Transcript_9951/g.17756 Transcript_9951/m.17756 type:complete len:266 (+) Transcript_9951:462-1259(+)